MAKAEKKHVSRIKIKKKAWYKIIAPKIFANKEIGESYLASPESAIGRVLRINLRDLTGNVKDQNAYATFRIDSVERNVLHTSPVGYELTAAYVKRMVRKNADRLDEFCRLKTSNGEAVCVKGLLLTRNKVHRSIQATLRKLFFEAMQEEASKGNFDVFVSTIVTNKVQSALKRKFSKVTPMKEVAIRVLKLQQGTKRPASSQRVPEREAEETQPDSLEATA